MNFKEVILKDGEGEAISPITIASSIYDIKGQPYINHNHDKVYALDTDVTNLQNTLNASIATKAPKKHTHTSAEVTVGDDYTTSGITEITPSASDSLTTALAKLEYGEKFFPADVSSREVSITAATGTVTLDSPRMYALSYVSYEFAYPGSGSVGEGTWTVKAPGTGLVAVWESLGSKGNVYLAQAGSTIASLSFSGTSATTKHLYVLYHRFV